MGLICGKLWLFCNFLPEICVFIAAKFDIIRLINGAIEPTSGTVEKTSEKTHITYHPYVPKDCYGMTVEAYLTENLPDGAPSFSNAKIQEVSGNIYYII